MVDEVVGFSAPQLTQIGRIEKNPPPKMQQMAFHTIKRSSSSPRGLDSCKNYRFQPQAVFASNKNGIPFSPKSDFLAANKAHLNELNAKNDPFPLSVPPINELSTKDNRLPVNELPTNRLLISELSPKVSGFIYFIHACTVRGPWRQFNGPWERYDDTWCKPNRPTEFDPTLPSFLARCVKHYEKSYETEIQNMVWVIEKTTQANRNAWHHILDRCETHIQDVAKIIKLQPIANDNTQWCDILDGYKMQIFEVIKNIGQTAIKNDYFWDKFWEALQTSLCELSDFTKNQRPATQNGDRDDSAGYEDKLTKFSKLTDGLRLWNDYVLFGIWEESKKRIDALIALIGQAQQSARLQEALCRNNFFGLKEDINHLNAASAAETTTATTQLGNEIESVTIQPNYDLPVTEESPPILNKLNHRSSTEPTLANKISLVSKPNKKNKKKPHKLEAKKKPHNLELEKSINELSNKLANINLKCPNGDSTKDLIYSLSKHVEELKGFIESARKTSIKIERIAVNLPNSLNINTAEEDIESVKNLANLYKDTMLRQGKIIRSYKISLNNLYAGMPNNTDGNELSALISGVLNIIKPSTALQKNSLSSNKKQSRRPVANLNAQQGELSANLDKIQDGLKENEINLEALNYILNKTILAQHAIRAAYYERLHDIDLAFMKVFKQAYELFYLEHFKTIGSEIVLQIGSRTSRSISTYDYKNSILSKIKVMAIGLIAPDLSPECELVSKLSEEEKNYIAREKAFFSNFVNKEKSYVSKNTKTLSDLANQANALIDSVNQLSETLPELDKFDKEDKKHNEQLKALSKKHIATYKSITPKEFTKKKPIDKRSAGEKGPAEERFIPEACKGIDEGYRLATSLVRQRYSLYSELTLLLQKRDDTRYIEENLQKMVNEIEAGPT